MTTKLTTSPVTRESARDYHPDGGGRTRPLIVTLTSDDEIVMRPKGSRGRPVKLSLLDAYTRAVLGSVSIPPRRK